MARTKRKRRSGLWPSFVDCNELAYLDRAKERNDKVSLLAFEE